MSLQHLAQRVRAQGRHGDTELVHMTRGEVDGLHGLARAMYGADLPINPETGLHEASWLKKLLPTLVGAATNYFLPGAGALGSALAGGVTGALTNKNDRMAGALAGAAGGYGGGKVMGALSGLGGAAQGAMGAPAADWASGSADEAVMAAQGGAGQAAQAAAPNLQAGIQALMAKPEGFKEALGGSYAPLAFAAAPLAMQDVPDRQQGGAGSGKDPARRKYGFEWVQDENGVYQGRYTRQAAAGGAIEHFDAGGMPNANASPRAQLQSGKGKEAQEAWDYLMGEGDLSRVQANAQKNRAAAPKPRELPTSGGGGGQLTPGGPDSVIAGGPTGGPGQSTGGQFGGAGGDGILGSAGGYEIPDINYGDYATPPTGGEVGAVGQGPGSVSGDTPMGAGTIGNIIGGAGLIAGVPGAGTIADVTGLSDYLARLEAERAGQANRDSVEQVAPPGDYGNTEGQAALAGMVDSAPVRGEMQETAAATPGTGGAAAQIGANAMQDGLAQGMSEAEAAEYAQDMVNATIANGGNDFGPAEAPLRYLGGIGGGGGVGRSSKFRTSQVQMMADGGPVNLQSGGFVFPADVVSALGAGSSGAGLEALAKRYGARPVQGKGHGQSDDVEAAIDGKQPARVARDEAVLDAAQVAKIGGGDAKKGAKKLYAMMERVRKSATGSPKQMRAVDANKVLR